NMADVMIPQTDTPGAVAVKAHLFALVMVDDCLGKGAQEQYLRGMRTFERALTNLTGKAFSSADATERLAMLTAFEAQSEQADEDTRAFYKRTRGYILQGYTS